ncbi:MAG: hypothetical protein AB4040_04025 [Synechococcus sp.]
METAENITLIIAIFLVLGQILSIRNAAIHGGGIFPASVPSLLFFIISIVIVLALQLSPFHLIWLLIVCFIVGILAIVSPQVQQLSMGFFVLLSMTGSKYKDDKEEEEKEVKKSVETDLPVFTNHKKAKEKKRGFG